MYVQKEEKYIFTGPAVHSKIDLSVFLFNLFLFLFNFKYSIIFFSHGF